MHASTQNRALRVLSHALRHSPATYGLQQDEHGWVDIHELFCALVRKLSALARFTEEEFKLLLDSSTRFQVSGRRVRALYGHSAERAFRFLPSVSPERLFHGTDEASFDRIRDEGLKRMARQFVHLTSDPLYALRARRVKTGMPVLLAVDAFRLAQDGALFHQATESVWLCDRTIAPSYLHRQRSELAEQQEMHRAVTALLKAR